jgi:hypothetical protein
MERTGASWLRRGKEIVDALYISTFREKTLAMGCFAWKLGG